MPLTPEDVSSKRFTPVRLREGYDMGEVDQFLDEIEAELTRLHKENDDLRVKAGESPSPATGSGATGKATGGAAATAGKTQESAKDATGDKAAAAGVGDSADEAEQGKPATETVRVETVAQASNAAARLLEIATRNADELVDGAKDEADKILGEARTKADRLDAESKEKADKLEADARGRSQMLDSETAERRVELFSDLETERDKLSGDVENLRAFEREYRSRLKTYFNQQLAALDSAGDGAVASDIESTDQPSSILTDD